MELKVNEAFAKHYNEYRSKEEAAKTKKKLRKEIKEINQSSSSSSDSEYDLNYQNTYVEQCNKLLCELDSKGVNVLNNPPTWVNDHSSNTTTVKTEKPIFAKDLNRKILLNGGIENEAELQEIEKISKIDSDYIINKCRKPIDIVDDLEHVSDDENFFKPSSKPQKYVIENTGKDGDDDNEETNITYSDEEQEESIQPLESDKALINHDRKLKSVRVSKTKTRAEKRQSKKERKEKELKDKMKRLQDIKTKSLLEKIDRIKKVIPQAAEHLILDNLDEDFDIDEVSKKLTEFFEKEDKSLPVDKEKPVFSDDSDIDNIGNSDNEENDLSGEENDNNNKDAEKTAVKKSSKSEKSEKPIDKNKTKSTFFTNLEILEDRIKKKSGIIRKNREIFDPEKHVKFSKYLKKNFDFCCEDLILGKDDGDDILCKFKFRQVEKQDYGLDTEEIILADPKELNKWASLKKITRIRTKIEEEKDRIRYEKMKNKKAEILKSVYCSDPEENEQQKEIGDREEKTEDKVLSKASKKRLRKTEKKRKLKEMILENGAEDLVNGDGEPMLKKSKKNGSDLENTQELFVENFKKKQSEECQINNEELTKFEKKKKKRRQETKNTTENINESESSNKKSKIDGENISDSNIKVKKKKLKVQCDDQVKKEVVQENTDSLINDHKTDQHKTHKKSKKHKNCTMSELSGKRLESIGIKTNYYEYVLKKGNK